MAFFVTIEKQTFKITKSIIIGRGAPFHHLNEFRDIEREHARIFKTKKGFFIRDLGSKAGTFVNGKKLEKGKAVSFKLEDEVKLAGHIVSLTTQKHPEAQVIKRSVGIHRDIPFWQLFIGSFLIVFLFFYLRHGVEKGLTLASFISLPLAGYIKFLFKLKRNNPGAVKEVLWGAEGFTVHFNDKTNMSVLFSDIERVRKKTGGLIVISVYDLEIIIGKHQKSEEFYELVEKKCSSEVFKKNIIKENIAFVVGFIFYFYLDHFNGKEWIITSIVAVGFFLASINRNVAKVFLRKFPERQLKKTQRRIFVPSLAMVMASYFHFSDYQATQVKIAKAKGCLVKQDKESCGQLKSSTFYSADKRFSKEESTKLFTIGCSLENKYACKWQKIAKRRAKRQKRKPASE